MNTQTENTFDSTEAALDAARSTETDPAVLAELAEHEDCEVREQVAGNPNTPVAVLIELAEDEDEDEDVLLAVAENANVTPAVLTALAPQRSRALARVILSKPEAPTEAIDAIEYWHDNSDYWEYGDLGPAILSHPNVPLATLEHNVDYRFSTDRQCAVARHPKTPADVLATLATFTPDEDESTESPEDIAEANGEIRAAVAENPNSPVAVLEMLAEDEDEDVASAAQDALDRLTK